MKPRSKYALIGRPVIIETYKIEDGWGYDSEGICVGYDSKTGYAVKGPSGNIYTVNGQHERVLDKEFEQHRKGASMKKLSSGIEPQIDVRKQLAVFRVNRKLDPNKEAEPQLWAFQIPKSRVNEAANELRERFGNSSFVGWFDRTCIKLF